MRQQSMLAPGVQTTPKIWCFVAIQHRLCRDWSREYLHVDILSSRIPVPILRVSQTPISARMVDRASPI